MAAHVELCDLGYEILDSRLGVLEGHSFAKRDWCTNCEVDYSLMKIFVKS